MTDKLTKPNGGVPAEAPPPPDLPPPAKLSQQRDAATQRVQAVGELLAGAYARASTLQLSEQERAALLAPFPDEAVRRGASGKEDLLYIEHAFLRGRLLEVFGPGGWLLVTRRTWFDDGEGNMYADCVLLVRGAMAGEAIGDQRYSKANKMINYSDAVEGAKSSALRRALKDMGVGLQVWTKAYCEGWKAREAARKRGDTVPNTPATAPTRPVATPEAAEAALTQIEARVATIEAKRTPGGKEYRILTLEGDNRSFSTWHSMKGVEVGTEIVASIKSQEKNGQTYWAIHEWDFADNPGDEAAGGEPEAPEPASPIVQLQQLVESNGFTLKHLLHFGNNTGQFDPPATGWNDIKEADAKRLLNSPNGVLFNLKAAKEQIT